MKRYVKIIVLSLLLSITVVPLQQARAQTGVLAVIQAGVKKAIKALDLRIQRLQNKTIWLQNAQKALENALSKLKLEEISDWTQKQKEQYKKYYQELAKVKALITYYQRIRDVAEKQARMVQEYNRSWQLIRQDENFTTDELQYMAKVYNGIFGESLENIDQITLIVQSFATEMSDAKRLQLINGAADQIDANYDDLRRFNRQNILLSLQRSKTQKEVESVKKLYGIQ